ncbi:MAG: 50S ribosomal protein L25 [Candidatus Cloacimonas sp.]|jgi:large subunit ribosomal protein L25|nr:50S ribosomal protein L25 [Candidatus Cloacimonas sp.]
MIFTLNAQTRHTVKKSDLTNLRASGMIPAVVYGNEMESLSISINKAEFAQLHKKSFTEVNFWEINCDGKKYNTILQARQIHPVQRNFLHLDFMVVSADSLIELEIPIHYLGEPIGLQEGGMLDILQRTLKVVCKSTDIPEELSLDVSQLKVGDSVNVRDLPQGKWQVKDHADVALAVVHAKKAEAVKEEEEPTPEA